MTNLQSRLAWAIPAAVLILWIGWAVAQRVAAPGIDGRGAAGPRAAAAVEVAAVEHGPIELVRTFSGALEAPAEFVVAPKIGGRIERVLVDLADVVTRGQTVAELDDEEYRQALAQAEAELAVTRARLREARSGLEIAQREFQRMKQLHDRGLASESQFDTASVEHLASEADAAVAEAEVARAEATVETAHIRLGYARVPASWAGGRDERVVAARFADEGDTVAANTALLSIVELDPLNAVFFVTEKDYSYLRAGQAATLATDAFPGESFEGRIVRVAPVFREASRQARVELVVENPEHRLKPGMFVRTQIVLDRVEDATIVPVDALVTRQGATVLFVVDEGEETVSMRPARVGIRAGTRVQVTGVDGATVEGRVVTLGQQLLDAGARITIPGDGEPDEPPRSPQ